MYTHNPVDTYAYFNFDRIKTMNKYLLRHLPGLWQGLFNGETLKLKLWKSLL